MAGDAERRELELIEQWVLRDVEWAPPMDRSGSKTDRAARSQVLCERRPHARYRYTVVGLTDKERAAARTLPPFFSTA